MVSESPGRWRPIVARGGDPLDAGAAAQLANVALGERSREQRILRGQGFDLVQEVGSGIRESE